MKIMYEGEWNKSRFEGLGRLIDIKGRIYNGNWRRGERIGYGV